MRNIKISTKGASATQRSPAPALRKGSHSTNTPTDTPPGRPALDPALVHQLVDASPQKPGDPGSAQSRFFQSIGIDKPSDPNAGLMAELPDPTAGPGGAAGARAASSPSLRPPRGTDPGWAAKLLGGSNIEGSLFSLVSALHVQASLRRGTPPPQIHLGPHDAVRYAGVSPPAYA